MGIVLAVILAGLIELLFRGRGALVRGLGCECCLSCWQTIDTKWVVLPWTIHFSRALRSTCTAALTKTSPVWLLWFSSFCYFSLMFFTLKTWRPKARLSWKGNILLVILLFQNNKKHLETSFRLSCWWSMWVFTQPVVSERIRIAENWHFTQQWKRWRENMLNHLEKQEHLSDFTHKVKRFTRLSERKNGFNWSTLQRVNLLKQSTKK